MRPTLTSRPDTAWHALARPPPDDRRAGLLAASIRTIWRSGTLTLLANNLTAGRMIT